MNESEKNQTYRPIRREEYRASDPDPGTALDPNTEYCEAVEQLERSFENRAALSAIEKVMEDSLANHGIQLSLKDMVSITDNGSEITDFAVVLLENEQHHTLDGTKHFMKILVLSKDVPPKTILVELSKIGSNNWIDELGPKYYYEKGAIALIEKILRLMAKYAPDNHNYEYSGWSTDGENIYIFNGNPLGGDKWDTYKAKDTCMYALDMLSVAPHSLTIPLLSVALLSLVHSRLMDQGDYFKGVICITALTQSFKTTLASLFFDFRNGREATTNFEATTTAIVRSIGNNRDAVAIVDDYKPGVSRTESNTMVSKLSKIVRMASDNSGGIQKAGTGNSTTANVAQGLVAVTAEPFQLEVQSTLARLLVLEMKRKDVDVEKLTYFQDNHQRYRDFIQGFICYIASKGVDEYCRKLINRFRNERNALRDKLTDKDMPVDNRTFDMCTWLWLSFSGFLDYALNLGAITQEQFESYSNESQTVFTSIIEHQAERVAELGPIRQFFLGLRVLYDTNEVKIQKLQPRNNGFYADDSKESIGFTKKGCIYLKNGDAIQAVINYWHHNGRDYLMSETALRKALADSGYIIPSNEKSYIHRLNICGARYQCIKFEEEKFYELLHRGKGSEAGDVEETPSDRGMRKNADHILGR